MSKPTIDQLREQVRAQDHAGAGVDLRLDRAVVQSFRSAL
jgi:hypothetical protein